MDKSPFEVAIDLAAVHRAEDPETTDVYVAIAADEVRLVEVSGSLGPAGEVLPFRFAAQPEKGIPYDSVLILLSPEDWDALQSGALHLPPGWGTPDQLKKIA